MHETVLWKAAPSGLWCNILDVSSGTPDLRVLNIIFWSILTWSVDLDTKQNQISFLPLFHVNPLVISISKNAEPDMM